MKRASYREGVKWIAWNDEAGSPNQTVSDIASYISTLLLADLFSVEPERVAKDIQRERERKVAA